MIFEVPNFIVMNTITYQAGFSDYSIQSKHKNALYRFGSWLESQEKNRLAWVGISITVMSAVFLPVTMAAILFNGAIFKLIIGAMFAFALVVITNLAALPAKYTIPAFLLGGLIDIGLIIASFIL